MNATLKKLGLTSQDPILILNAPDEYRGIMVETEVEVHEEVKGKYKFIQVFAKDSAQVNKYTSGIIEALEDDGYLWLCYPKGTSKKYKSDINRTKLMDIFASYNFEPVSQVSIDDDWSAMRFRHIDKIKTMKRKTAVTEKGKERIKDN